MFFQYVCLSLKELLISLARNRLKQQRSSFEKQKQETINNALHFRPFLLGSHHHQSVSSKGITKSNIIIHSEKEAMKKGEAKKQSRTQKQREETSNLQFFSLSLSSQSQKKKHTAFLQEPAEQACSLLSDSLSSVCPSVHRIASTRKREQSDTVSDISLPPPSIQFAVKRHINAKQRREKNFN